MRCDRSNGLRRSLRTWIGWIAAGGVTAALAAVPSHAVGGSEVQAPVTRAESGPDRDDSVRPNFDSRLSDRAVSVSSDVAVAQGSLARRLGPQGLVQVDPATGTPRMVARLDGFLTGPSDRPAADVALSYVRSHLEAFGLSRRDLTQMHLTKDYVDILGTHHLVWQQRVAGIPAFDNGLRANVTKDGRLVNVLGSPIHGLSPESVRPALSAAEARTAALRNGGARGTPPARRQSSSVGPQQRTVWAGGDRAELVLFGSPEPGGATLAWQVDADVSDAAHYVSVVDAESGAVLWRSNMVHSDTGDGNAWAYYPGAPSGGTAEPVTFPVRNGTELRGNNAHVYKDLIDSIEVPGKPAPDRAEIPARSGLNWSGYTVELDTTSSGRNCSAARPCTWNHNRAFSWRRNANHTAVQIYYFVNTFHDHLLAEPIGFTPEAGNFQRVNPPGEGLGGDAVMAQINDGANLSSRLCGQYEGAGGFPDVDHASNANMDVTQDGVPPKMQMYLWPSDPRRCRINGASADTNGGDDASVVYHEYTHGLSNRLVTTNTGVPALDTFQSASMGEAWSDWYALDLLVNQGHVTDAPTAGDLIMGPYGTGGRGIRSEATDCHVGSSASVCPGVPGHAGPGGYTYGDLTKIFLHPRTGKPLPEVHADGEIWAQTLWQIRQEIGSVDAATLITRGMELSPPHPSFLDMRNSILLADRVAFDGAYTDLLWEIFAERGMGFFADSATGNDFHPVEDFQVPADCPGSECARVYGQVTDSLTGKPVVNARVWFGGHDGHPGAGFSVDLSTRTDVSGHFSIRDVPFGTYPRLLASKKGHQLRIRRDVRVRTATKEINPTLVRNWAAFRGGARITNFNGPNYEEELGCGPRHAIDYNVHRGWLSDAVDAPGQVRGPKFIVVKLPRAVNITTIGLDPGAACNFKPRTALKTFTIKTKKRQKAPWVRAAGRKKPLPQHQFSLLRPSAGDRHVRFVKLIMLDNRHRPGKAGRLFMGMSELTVHGRPAR